MAESDSGPVRPRRDGSSLLRANAYLDPVALTGIALSMVVSLLLDVTGAAGGVDSFQACLMGITISLVLDSIVRAERRFRIRDLIAATPWLDKVLGPLADATAQVERRYAGTVVESEARSRYAALGADLDELCHGRIRRSRDDYEYLLRSTRECGRTLHAVTNVLAERSGHGMDWWSGGIGRDYWQANLDAIGRGVRISRIFIYTELTAELIELAAAQEEGGVQVGFAAAGDLDPEMLHNLAIWDDASAWEARLNAACRCRSPWP
jgi:hypothetical protein